MISRSTQNVAGLSRPVHFGPLGARECRPRTLVQCRADGLMMIRQRSS
jgi:hypothetical protein